MSENSDALREIRCSVVLSVIIMMCGTLAIVLPHAVWMPVKVLIGSFLALNGAARMAYARQSGGGFWWGVLLGLIQMAAGSYVLVDPGASLVSCSLVLGASLCLGAILQLIVAYLLRLFVVEATWLLLDGIVTLVLGAMIWRIGPSGTPSGISTLVGISMLFSGIARLRISLYLRGQVQRLGAADP